MEAVRQGNGEIARFLIKKGAAVDQRYCFSDRNGNDAGQILQPMGSASANRTMQMIGLIGRGEAGYMTIATEAAAPKS